MLIRYPYPSTVRVSEKDPYEDTEIENMLSSRICHFVKNNFKASDFLKQMFIVSTMPTLKPQVQVTFPNCNALYKYSIAKRGKHHQQKLIQALSICIISEQKPLFLLQMYILSLYMQNLMNFLLI